MFHESFADHIQRSRHRAPYLGSQFRANLKITAHYAKQAKVFELDTGGIGRVKCLRQAWLVSAQSHSRQMLAQLRLLKGKHFARLASAGKRIEQDDNLTSRKVIDKIKRGRAEVEQFNLGPEFVFRLKARYSLRAEAVVL